MLLLSIATFLFFPFQKQSTVLNEKSEKKTTFEGKKNPSFLLCKWASKTISSKYEVLSSLRELVIQLLIKWYLLGMMQSFFNVFYLDCEKGKFLLQINQTAWWEFVFTKAEIVLLTRFNSWPSSFLSKSTKYLRLDQ